MTTDTSFLNFILSAGIIVKIVMLILLAASISSWAVIFERWKFYKKQWQETKAFQKRFWSGIALNDLYREVVSNSSESIGLPKVFAAGFETFSKLKESGNHDADNIMDGTQRAMQVAESDTLDQLEQSLPLLATVGSVSPFVGIFGTVWGIMTAFQSLGTMQQASIAAVAPGISEALITTALGLFAAIPAAVAYNRFTQHVSRLQNRAEMFSGEIANILQRVTQ